MRRLTDRTKRELSPGAPPIHRALGTLLALACAMAVLPAAAAPARAATPYTTQLTHDRALFRVNATNNAGAQEFVVEEAPVRTVGAYIVNQAAHGEVEVSVRRDVADPTTTLASQRIDLAGLGGWGRGWIEVTFSEPVDVTPGVSYFLVVQAHGADGTVVWNGTRGAVPGALPSWNYDQNYWGGWQAYDETTNFSDSHLAFTVDPHATQMCAALGACYTATPRPPAALHWEGLLGNATTVVGVSREEAAGAAYVPHSSVLRLAGGELRYVPEGATAPVTVPPDDPGALAAIAADRAWLAEGTVPGRTPEEREAAARALLDMRLLAQPNGAIAAAWWSIWQYSWPRDGSFVAAALSYTGHHDEAYELLRFMADVQREDGTWEARYHLDGEPVLDGRRWQLDANGWVPWATWVWFTTAEPRDRKVTRMRPLWPAIQASADYVVASLGENGLPPVSPDYWENAVDAPTIGTAAPVLAGLRAAAELAGRTGHRHDADRYAATAVRLQEGIDTAFAPLGYPRTPTPDSGADSAVVFMAPPFAPETPQVRSAIEHAADVLTLPNGGILPGEDWRGDPFDAWTPETGFFALAAAASGHVDDADHWLGWLLDHRTSLGAFPEKVRSDGQPLSVAPLAWTNSIVVMTLVALEEDLGTPPVACRPAGHPAGAYCPGRPHRGR